MDVTQFIQQEDLNALSNCFLDKFQGEHYTLLSDERFKEIGADIPQLKDLVSALQLKIREILKNSSEPKLIIHGLSNIMRLSDTSSMDTVKSLVKAIDERKDFMDMLVKHLSKKECDVLIGSESEFEKLRDCSIVLSSYGSKKNPLGMLGLVGPKRMKYSKALALVNTMKTTLDGYFNNKFV